MNITFKIPFTKHKSFEFVARIDSSDNFINLYFNIDMGWTKKSDHAGFNFFILLHRFHLELNIYDNRHWNYETNAWMTTDEWDKIIEESNIEESKDVYE
jgi:hypothetical protein